MRCERPGWGEDESKWRVWLAVDGWMVQKPYETEVYYYGIPEFAAVEELFEIERLRWDFDNRWSLIC
jgi:hypothetical protein